MVRCDKIRENIVIFVGVSRNGRFAALTNFLERGFSAFARPRGALVTDFLSSSSTPEDFCKGMDDPHAYNGFNLLVADTCMSNVLFVAMSKTGIASVTARCAVFSNRDPIRAPVTVDYGVHVLSNHLLDAPWHKMQRCKSLFGEAVRNPDVSADDLFTVLNDEQRFAAHSPDVFDCEFEYALSSIRCWHPSQRYGTRYVMMPRIADVCIDRQPLY